VTPAGKAWLALAGGIIAWEATCDRDQLLSAEADRWIAKRPILARLGIVTVGTLLTAHVANLWPNQRLDPIAYAFWSR